MKVSKMKIARHLKRANSSAGRRIMIILIAAGLSLGASAQRGVGYHGGGRIGGGVVYRPAVVYAYPSSYFGVGFGLGLGFGPWGPFWGPYGWGTYPYPPYYYGYGSMPSQLAVQVQDIKNDYNAQIKDVRHDKSIARSDRKAKINQLKKDRDAAVIQARHDYFNRNYRRDNSNGPQPYNGNGSQPQQQQKDQKPVSGSGEQPEYQNSGSSTGGTTTQE